MNCMEKRHFTVIRNFLVQFLVYAHLRGQTSDLKGGLLYINEPIANQPGLSKTSKIAIAMFCRTKKSACVMTYIAPYAIKLFATKTAVE